MIVSINVEFERWTRFLPNESVATAILDRLLHHCHVIRLAGGSSGCARDGRSSHPDDRPKRADRYVAASAGGSQIASERLFARGDTGNRPDRALSRPVVPRCDRTPQPCGPLRPAASPSAKPRFNRSEISGHLWGSLTDEIVRERPALFWVKYRLSDRRGARVTRLVYCAGCVHHFRTPSSTRAVPWLSTGPAARQACSTGHRVAARLWRRVSPTRSSGDRGSPVLHCIGQPGAVRRIRSPSTTSSSDSTEETDDPSNLRVLHLDCNKTQAARGGGRVASETLPWGHRAHSLATKRWPRRQVDARDVVKPSFPTCGRSDLQVRGEWTSLNGVPKAGRRPETSRLEQLAERQAPPRSKAIWARRAGRHPRAHVYLRVYLRIPRIGRALSVDPHQQYRATSTPVHCLGTYHSWGLSPASRWLHQSRTMY
jgi:hypothetical protein